MAVALGSPQAIFKCVPSFVIRAKDWHSLPVPAVVGTAMSGSIGSVALPDLADPEFVVPQLALNHLPPALLAVFVGALLAAIMSSADSALLAPATLLSANIVPFFKPDVTQEERLAWARYSIPVIGVIALVVALRVQTVYDLTQEMEGLTGVRRVDSLRTVPVIEARPDGSLSLDPALGDGVPRERQGLDALAARLRRDRIAPRNLLSARSRDLFARSTSMSSAASTVCVSTMTLLSRTSAYPPLMAYRSVLLLERVVITSFLNAARNGVCPGNTLKSPSIPGTVTESTVSVRRVLSGATTSS